MDQPLKNVAISLMNDYLLRRERSADETIELLPLGVEAVVNTEATEKKIELICDEDDVFFSHVITDVQAAELEAAGADVV